MSIKNIVLCGCMGCGKTTVGKLLAKTLDRPFVDTDAYIERQTGETIPALFEKNGEAFFRALERAACHQLSMGDGQIIATGGGALLNPVTAERFRQNGTIVFLDTTAEVLYARLKSVTDRPLLNGGNRLSSLKALCLLRRPLYSKAADITVNAAVSPEEVAAEILAAIS